jgi:uncharacterized GH25 family protein
MNSRLSGIIAALALATAAQAHSFWITPAAATCKPGETVRVEVGQGHDFPNSEAAPDLKTVAAFAITPGGKKVPLTLTVDGAVLSAAYPATEAGTHRFYFVRDRGILSRTPQGLKPGGRDKNPNATRAFKYIGTASAAIQAGTGPEKAAAPLGLPFELLAAQSGGAVSFTALRDSKPAAGAVVEALLGGKEAEIGKTGPDGKLSYKLPAGTRGRQVFAAALEIPAPAGSGFDAETFVTAVVLNVQ